MFITEKYQDLQGKFTALEQSYNNSKTEFDAANVKVTALETQIAELTKVKTDLEGKLKTLTDDPNITAKVQELTKQNGEFKAQVESLTKEKEEASAKVINLEKEMEQKVNIKAAEIIASGKVTSPLPITADTQPEIDVAAFLEELEKKPNTQAKAQYISEHPQVWKEVLTQREKMLKGRR